MSTNPFEPPKDPIIADGPYRVPPLMKAILLAALAIAVWIGALIVLGMRAFEHGMQNR